MILVDSFTYYGICLIMFCALISLVIYIALFIKEKNRADKGERYSAALECRIKDLTEKYERKIKAKSIMQCVDRFYEEAENIE